MNASKKSVCAFSYSFSLRCILPPHSRMTPADQKMTNDKFLLKTIIADKNCLIKVSNSGENYALNYFRTILPMCRNIVSWQNNYAKVGWNKYWWLLSKLHVFLAYSGKAHIFWEGQKFCEIFPLLLTVCNVVKSKGKVLQNFVVFSKYMNVKRGDFSSFLGTVFWGHLLEN